MSTPFGLDLVKLDVAAPQPYMRPRVAERYNLLRQKVEAGSGIDFLARVADMFRDAGLRSKKDGVAFRSWHKTGRCFDFDQESKAIVIVPEPIGGKQFFRTYLKCARQDGSLGVKRTVREMRGYNVNAYLYDFTADAGEVGFSRIPAWNGWNRTTRYNRMEFWHYQHDEGLTWDAAMLQLRGTPTKPAPVRPAGEEVYGFNDRGDAVRAIQTRLAALKLLPQKEVDGIYGTKTKAAVERFQRSAKLDIDGLAGPATRAKLFS